MTEYKKLLIKQQRHNGSSYVDVGGIIDTKVAFNIVCQEFPFKVLPETKELPSRDWHDQDGEDVYIPPTGLRFKAYDLEVKFLYTGTEQTMQSDLNRFIKFLYGRNNGGAPYLAVYDEYTKTGRQGIYTANVDNELLAYDNCDTDVVAVLKVKFRVTDPVTELNSQLQPISDSSSSD